MTRSSCSSTHSTRQGLVGQLLYDLQSALKQGHYRRQYGQKNVHRNMHRSGASPLQAANVQKEALKLPMHLCLSLQKPGEQVCSGTSRQRREAKEGDKHAPDCPSEMLFMQNTKHLRCGCNPAISTAKPCHTEAKSKYPWKCVLGTLPASLNTIGML